MSLYEARSLRNELMTCLEMYAGLILDLDHVSNCDTAGVQLLCSAHKWAELKGKVFLIKGASGPVRDAFCLVGLHRDEILDNGKEVSDG
jgi:anti-anti-sigma regulatory factor